MWPFSKSPPKPEPLILTLARKPDLDQETAFTICQLIDCVGSSLASNWDWDWLDTPHPDYRALINIRLLTKAWKALAKKDWLSLQTTNDEDKRITTISPLAEFIRLETLVLQNNLIEDLSPLKALTRLKRLSCFQNRISDIGVLRNFQSMEELTLNHNPLTSLAELQDMPKLRTLSLSTDQLPLLRQCRRLASLSSLEAMNFQDDVPPDNLEGWPEMPSLKVLKLHHLQSLAGIERFASLETLDCAAAQFATLAPLSSLKRLTHFSLYGSIPLDVAPLAQLHALRHISISCPKVHNLAVLDSLPALHEVEIKEDERREPEQVRALRQETTSWDIEFKNEAKGVQPSLDLQIINQATFDHYDTKAAYGIGPGETHDGMFDSEREWLLDQIREALSVDFVEDTDFVLPVVGGLRRSESLIIQSLGAYESFRDIALRVQQILCETKNDWIVWCQSLLYEGPDWEELPEGIDDFIVWLYPDKILTTASHAATVRQLIEWKQ